MSESTVPPGLPGPPKHGDPAKTLSNNVIVEHKNPLATDHQKATRDNDSAKEQKWDLERAKQGSKQFEIQILENKKAFEIERSKQEQKRIERQNLEIELMCELMKAKHELEVLESQ